MRTRDALNASGLLLLIAGAGGFVWKNLNTTPEFNTALHEGIGIALAEETIRSIGNKGDIHIITMADGDSEILATQFAAFRRRIEKSSVTIREIERIDSDKKDKYGPGVGLSAGKLTREVGKSARREAIVSFIGLPKMDAAELDALGSNVPPLLAFSRMPDKLGPLLKHGCVAAVVVPRFKFPAPGPESPSTPGEWFTNQYQIITRPR